MLLFDADGTPSPPTPTPWPTHHFLPTRTPTPTPFISVLATPTFPASGVRAVPVETATNGAWLVNLAIVIVFIAALVIDRLKKGVYNKHARVDR